MISLIWNKVLPITFQVTSCKSFIILQYVHMPIKYNYLINIFFLILKYLA
jgi:hypothetical protein